MQITTKNRIEAESIMVARLSLTKSFVIFVDQQEEYFLFEQSWTAVKTKWFPSWLLLIFAIKTTEIVGKSWIYDRAWNYRNYIISRIQLSK